MKISIICMPNDDTPIDAPSIFEGDQDLVKKLLDKIETLDLEPNRGNDMTHCTYNVGGAALALAMVPQIKKRYIKDPRQALALYLNGYEFDNYDPEKYMNLMELIREADETYVADKKTRTRTEKDWENAKLQTCVNLSMYGDVNIWIVEHDYQIFDLGLSIPTTTMHGQKAYVITYDDMKVYPLINELGYRYFEDL